MNVRRDGWRACVACRTENAYDEPDILCGACRAKRKQQAAEAAEHIKKKRDRRRQKDEE